ncbi:Peroxidase 25 [Vitis vinifera]|uniref:peroxidase n=1 Tax=Vitis vinifera TaxID=29760 RepID=A0A438C0K7_VITVI|nr:Peroxidase 25 [Vitis vinifera]
MSCYAPPTHWCSCCNSVLYQAILVATLSHGIAPWPNHPHVEDIALLCPAQAFDLRCMLGAKDAQVCGMSARARTSAHAGMRSSARKHVCNHTHKHASNHARGHANNRAHVCQQSCIQACTRACMKGQPKKPFVPLFESKSAHRKTRWEACIFIPDALNLLALTDSIHVLRQKFAAKGLNNHDLVTLVGAHTIGQTDCSFFQYRLYNFMEKGNADPTINQAFLAQLHALCPECAMSPQGCH